MAGYTVVNFNPPYRSRSSYLFVRGEILRKISFQSLQRSCVNTSGYFELCFDCKCQLTLGLHRRHSRYRRRRFTRVLACPLITPTAVETTTRGTLMPKYTES